LKREYCIKYLGILIDFLSKLEKTSWIYWKKNQEKYWHLMQVKTLCWFEYFGETLLCFNLSFFDLWNSSLGKYETTLKPIFIPQKKAVRIITFSKLDSYSSPLFKSLGIIKFFDIALFQIAIFMYKFHDNVLPAAFHCFFYQGIKCS